jgi:hypothetical protein
MAQTQAAQVGSSMPHEALNGTALPQGGSPPGGGSPPLAASPFGASPLPGASPVGGSPPLGSSPPGGPPRGKPPRPKPAIKLAAGTTAAAGTAQPQAAAAGVAAAGAAGGTQHALPRPPSGASSSTSEGPLTFTSPSLVAAQLRQSAAAAAAGSHAAHQQQQQPAGPEGQAGGVLRTSSGSVEPRLRRTVSWSDMENRAPLAQVVEYEPSESRSVHSEDDWTAHPSGGCICTIQ